MTDWGFTAKQRRSIACATADASLQQINLWHGAVRSGKTIGSLVKFLMVVAQAPTSGEIVMVGRTRDTLHRNVIAPMQDPALFGEYARHVHYNRGAPTATILGRMVHVIGASDARAENVIRGLTVAVAYVDEVSLAAEEFFNQLMARCSVPGAWVGATTNPDGPEHWLKKQWIDRADERGHRIFHFTLRDNADHLPAGLIEAYEAQYTGLWRKRMIDGEWSLADGVIYDMFDPDQHIVTDLPDMDWLIALGVDHGVTNPTAGILLGHHDGHLYAVAEWAPGPGTDAERSASLREFVADHGMPDMLFVDPAAAGFRGQLIADQWPAVYKASNAVLDGIGTVASLLSAGRLRIHESCTNLLKEIPGYVWDAKASEKGVDAPIKLNDHYCFTAGTMVATPSGERPIESMQPGEEVLTADGVRIVEAVGMTAENAETVTVEFSNGATLTGTGNHPVWTANRGWIRLDSLRYTDKIETCSDVWKQSPSMESSSVGTPTLSAGQTSCISRPELLTNSVESSACTKKCGCTPTVSTASRKGGMFTTSTTTRATTIRATWKRCLLASIDAITATSQDRKLSSRTGRRLSLPPLIGMGQRKDESGTVNTGSVPGRGARTDLSVVNNAGTSTAPGRRKVATVSARTPASPHGVGPQDSTMSTECAPSAESRSGSTSTARSVAAPVRVERLGPGPTAAVFNLKVAGTPEFYANGIRVHNCDALRYACHSSRHAWRPRLPDLHTTPTEEAA